MRTIEERFADLAERGHHRDPDLAVRHALDRARRAADGAQPPRRRSTGADVGDVDGRYARPAGRPRGHHRRRPVHLVAAAVALLAIATVVATSALDREPTAVETGGTADSGPPEDEGPEHRVREPGGPVPNLALAEFLWPGDADTAASLTSSGEAVRRFAAEVLGVDPSGVTLLPWGEAVIANDAGLLLAVMPKGLGGDGFAVGLNSNGDLRSLGRQVPEVGEPEDVDWTLGFEPQPPGRVGELLYSRPGRGTERMILDSATLESGRVASVPGDIGVALLIVRDADGEIVHAVADIFAIASPGGDVVPWPDWRWPTADP